MTVQDVYHVNTLQRDTLCKTVSQETWKSKLLKSGRCFTFIDASVMTPDGLARFGDVPYSGGKPLSAS